MLDATKPLIEAGFACHWLRARSKAPAAEAWSSAPVYSAAELAASEQPGANIGVRLGEPSRVREHYLHLIDLDLREPALKAEALAALASFVPEYASLPYVDSGSGGGSRHFYLLTERPFRSRKLAHSAAKMTDAAGKEHWAWEVELYGTGKQAVLPPSIHPTGGKYAWGRPFDFEELDLGVGPFIGEARVAKWAPAAAAPPDEDDDGMMAEVRAKPMGLSPKEIAACLAALPLADWCEDRDGWLTVGMALHHEFQGSAAGLQVWNAFSKQSKKFDERDQARVWKSFEGGKRPTRMATLLKAAAEARFSADDYGDDVDLTAEDDDDDDVSTTDLQVDDLLGDVMTTDVQWTSLLDLNEEGAIKPTLHNVELIVRNDPRTTGLAAFNAFTLEVVLRGTPGTLKQRRKRAKKTRQLGSHVFKVADPVNGDLWIDSHDFAIRSIIEAPKSQGGYGLKLSDRDLRAALDIVANDNRFHPIREYLNALTWDGQPRADTLFIRHLGAADTPYSRSISRLTLLGAVTRVFEPGHKFDFVTILEGVQGKRKSTFIDLLARHWFSEIEGNFDDRKQMVEKMQGKWILELPELQGFSRHDVQIIKSFVSAKVDKVRLAYAHRARDYARQCIFIGSTNDSTYLRDDTGGRRFWPVACPIDEIDTEAFKAEVDQVWAEATAIYRQMRADQPHGTLPLYITNQEARAEALVTQEERRMINVDDEIAGRIAEWLERPLTDEAGFDQEDELLGGPPPRRNVVCSTEVWCEMMGKEFALYGQVQQQSIGRALRKVPGWLPGGYTRLAKYGRQRVYRRIGASSL